MAATRLRRMLPREHRVVLVERESQHVFSPSFLWVMIGRVDKLERMLQQMIEREAAEASVEQR